MQAIQGQSSLSVYVFDGGLEDLEGLTGYLPEGARSIVVQPWDDAWQKVQGALADWVDIGALHIVTHGNTGRIRLGDAGFDARGIVGAAAVLAQIGDRLTADADMLIYGCGIEVDAQGREFVLVLDADVAAGTNSNRPI